MEQEIWGFFPSELEYTTYLDKFITDYGTPIEKKRLAISFWDPNINNEIDTRIRITDGYAELMQKVGKWENQDEIHMKEIDLPLPSDANYLLTLYQILRNNLPLTKSPFITVYHNRFFQIDSFELKLSKQYGKEIRHTFEVEKLDEEAELDSFALKSGLKKYVLKTDNTFWKKWSDEMDILADNLTENELFEVIAKHLVDSHELA